MKTKKPVRQTSHRPPKLRDVHTAVKQCLREGRYIETWHAEGRQAERDVTILEIRHVLLKGRRVPMRDRYDPAYGGKVGPTPSRG